ncbi:MAG: 30S ribosomal protein S16 [Myxococcota bacterium]
MLTLRLSRAGTKKRPVYHLVAADKRARRDGRFVENLGYYIPARNVLVLKQDRIDYWLSVGAATTEVARRLILKAKKDGNTEPTAKPKYVAPPVKPVEVKADAKKGGADKKAEAKTPPEAKPDKGAQPNEKKD